MIATWMLIAFPGVFLFFNVYIVWSILLASPLGQRKVHMFVRVGESFGTESSFVLKTWRYFFRKKTPAQSPEVYFVSLEFGGLSPLA